jgi:hypothetical protein
MAVGKWFRTPDAWHGTSHKPLHDSIILIYQNLQERKKTGLYQSAFIIKTFATHFGANGVNTDPTAIGPRPSGALSLSLTAVSIRLPFILILKPDISKGSTCS